MSEQAVQFERTQTCAYCGSDIAIPAGATQVTCEFCRRLTVLPHFTQKEREIRDAGLVIFENDDHFAYLRQWQRFVTVVRAFLV